MPVDERQEYGREEIGGEGPLVPLFIPPIPPVTPLRLPREDIEVVVVDQLGNRIKQIPDCIVDNVQWNLNDVDTASISFPAVIESLVDRSTSLPTVYPRLRKDEIQIWHNEELKHWGVAWRRRVTGSDGKCQITCEDPLSYLKQRFVSNSSIDFSDGIEQANIAIAIMEYAQGHGFGNTQPNRELNITYPFTEPTGHVRARLYERDKHANLLDLLKEFPTLKDGFDWALVPYGDGRREFTIFYPTRGVRQASLVVELTRNIGDLTFDEDATKLVNESWFTGASDGAVKLENVFIDPDSAAFYGIAQKFSSDSSEYDVQWLLEEAQRETELYRTPALIPELTALPTPVALLGVLQPGDIIPVRIDYGQVQTKDDYRITKITWAPGDGTGGSGSGGESLKIDCMAKGEPIAGLSAPTKPAPIPTGTYTDWLFPDTGLHFYNYDFQISVDVQNNPTTDSYFWSQQFAHGLTGGSTAPYGGYMGIQNGTGPPNDPAPGKRALASVWGAVDARTGDAGSWAGPFVEGGAGYSINLHYNWIEGRAYRLRTWSLSTDSGGTWWGFWIKDMVTGVEAHIGDIKIPLASGFTLINGPNTCFTERYDGRELVVCTDIGQVSARFLNETMNNGSLGPTTMTSHLSTQGTCNNAMVDSPSSFVARHQMGIR